MAQFGNRVIYDLRDVLFKHQQIIGLKCIDRMGVGRMMCRIENDVSVLEDFLTTGLIGFVSDTLVLVGVILAMFALNWRLALIAYTVMPVMIIMMLFWRRRRGGNVYRAIRAAHERAADGQLRGEHQRPARGAVVRAGRPQLLHISRDQRGEPLDANADAARLSAFLFPAVDVLSALSIAVVLFFGGRIVINAWAACQAGGLTVGALAAFLGYVTRFFQPVRQLSDRYNTLQASTVAGERIFELLDQPADILDAPNAPPSAARHGGEYASSM